MLAKPTLDIEEEQARTRAAFLDCCESNQILFAEKNRQYGNAIVKTGVVGATVELIGVVARLRQLVLKSPNHGRDEIEAIMNVARDAHNYANILWMMLQMNNWEGE